MVTVFINKAWRTNRTKCQGVSLTAASFTQGKTTGHLGSVPEPGYQARDGPHGYQRGSNRDNRPFRGQRVGVSRGTLDCCSSRPLTHAPFKLSLCRVIETRSSSPIADKGPLFQGSSDCSQSQQRAALREEPSCSTQNRATQILYHS